MKFSIKKILVIALSIIFLFAIAVFIVGLNIVKDWNKVKTETVGCSKTNLVKLKDVEGNTFVFTDTVENSNLKTNNITFNEKNLGIKSLAKVNDSNPSINYLSKNDKLTYDELINLQDCYKGSAIAISNNYNFEKAQDNKFCNFVLKSGESYELSKCE
jgi:lipopolysaccharide export LptBFGC system permease protein LptF